MTVLSVNVFMHTCEDCLDNFQMSYSHTSFHHVTQKCREKSRIVYASLRWERMAFTHWLRVINLFLLHKPTQTLKLLIIKFTHLKINTRYAVWGKCFQNMLKHSILHGAQPWHVGCWRQQKLFIRDAFGAKLTGSLQGKERAGKSSRPRHLQSSSFSSPAQGWELSSIIGVYSIFVKQRIRAPLWWLP